MAAASGLSETMTLDDDSGAHEGNDEDNGDDAYGIESHGEQDAIARQVQLLLDLDRLGQIIARNRSNSADRCLVLWGTTGFQSDQQVVAQNNGMYQNNLAWTSTRRIGLIISVVTSTVTLNICRQKPAPASSAWWLVRHAAFKWAKRFSQTTTT